MLSVSILATAFMKSGGDIKIMPFGTRARMPIRSWSIAGATEERLINLILEATVEELKHRYKTNMTAGERSREFCGPIWAFGRNRSHFLFNAIKPAQMAKSRQR